MEKDVRAVRLITCAVIGFALGDVVYRIGLTSTNVLCAGVLCLGLALTVPNLAEALYRKIKKHG